MRTLLTWLALTGAGVMACWYIPDAEGVAAQSAAQNDVPPYHVSEASAKPFPRLLAPETFQNPVVRKVYQIAATIPGVLAQQPCYCYCNRAGHKGLLDCHRDAHSAG